METWKQLVTLHWQPHPFYRAQQDIRQQPHFVSSGGVCNRPSVQVAQQCGLKTQLIRFPPRRLLLWKPCLAKKPSGQKDPVCMSASVFSPRAFLREGTSCASSSQLLHGLRPWLRRQAVSGQRSAVNRLQRRSAGLATGG